MDIEDAIEGVSPVLVLGSLIDGVLDGSGDSNGKALFVIEFRVLATVIPLIPGSQLYSSNSSPYHAGRK